VLEEIAQVATVDVVLQSRCGKEIRKRCVTTPTQHQSILLNRLGMHLPRSLKTMEDVVKKLCV
jgi:hypothetical protein